MLEAARIRDAITGVLEGAIGDVRTMPPGALRSGVFEDLGPTARGALCLQVTHGFDVEFVGIRNHDATALGVANYKLSWVDVVVRVTTRTQSTVQEDLRGAVASALLQDMDLAIQALAFPQRDGNLAADRGGQSTEIIGGILTSSTGEGYAEWSVDDFDWAEHEIRSRITGSLVVRVTQRTS